MIKRLLNLLLIKSVNITQSRNMTHKVFVYGTLKRNEPNHHWLTNPENGVGKFIAHGVTKSKFPLIIATKYNIPFLLYVPGKGNNVRGEVYEVDELMLTKLDILEEHPKSYIREMDDIIVSNPTKNEQETIKCWIYFLKTFRPHLQDLPAMAEYSSKGPHGLPYCESDDDESTVQELLDEKK